MIRAGRWDAPEPCSGTLKDARVSPPDLLQMLGRIRGDLLALYEPPLADPAAVDRRTRDRQAALGARLQDVIDEVGTMPLAADVDCGYDGELDEVRYVRSAGLIMWACPRCGYENESAAPEPDPDLARDALLEDRL